MKGEKTLFSKESDEWETPQQLFDELNKEFHFTIDGAASSGNKKCPRWLGPGSDIGEDALQVDLTSEVVWLNPPYSMIKDFLGWAWKQSYVKGNTVVLLIPARTDTKWFHHFIWDTKNSRFYENVEVRFLKGRVKFVRNDGKTGSAPFPSMIVVME